MNAIVTRITERWHSMMFILFVACSAAAFGIVQRSSTLFIYDDGVSYLTIARSVFDNVQPGIEQIGSIWLPLNHLAKLPFIWNDFLFQSSLAGSFLSMISYVAVCAFVYKIAHHITGSRVHSSVAAVVCALNPTLLFLQSTAMSEVPFMAFFIVSAYYFMRYVEARGVHYLAILGLVNAAMLLVRYEGWFVVLVQAALVLWGELAARTTSLKEIVGRLFVLLMPVALAVLAWVLWNYNITGDPLYFVRGEFSASVFTDRQQEYGVVAEGNPLVSLVLYMGAAVGLIGLPVLIAALVGQLGWLLNWSRGRVQSRLRAIDMKRATLALVLLSPALFHIVTMFFGFSIMRVAGIGGDTTSLNIRYGIFLLPYAAIGIALVSKRSLVVLLIGGLSVLSYGPMVMGGDLPIIEDAREGQIRYQEAATVLRNNVRKDDTVLVSMATNSAFTFHSQLPLKTFVHEGVSEQWASALANPEEVDWVVTSRRLTFDSLAELDTDDELRSFSMFYTNDDIILYRKKQ